MKAVPVRLGSRSYEVLIGSGVRHRLAEAVPHGVTRAAIVTQSAIGIEIDPGVNSRVFAIGDGDDAKTLSTVEELCRGFARWGINRRDLVIGLGGGVVTDVAGFAASVYHRGVRVIHVPTTLLAQVDAAIGGKTGVNLAEGKNLVGTYWQPTAVLCDVDTLASLPRREYVNGLGEVAKYSLLGGGRLHDLPLEEMVARSVEIKAKIVSGDERESGRRALLNYGHTLGHALEALCLVTASQAGVSAGVGAESYQLYETRAVAGAVDTKKGYDLRHGECVAVGLVFAARLARRLGRIGDEAVEHHVEEVRAHGLPSALPQGIGSAELIKFMTRDKKARSGLTFVLAGPEGPEVVSGIDPADVRATLIEMGAP